MTTTRETAKSVGQLAYEAELAARPRFPLSLGGGRRPTWDELPATYQVNWDRHSALPAPADRG